MTSLQLAAFVSGAMIGLTVAVPIGPMGVLCIQRTLAFGLAAGLATGLGTATVHLAFGSLAALGLGATMMAWLGSGTQAPALLSAGLLFWFAARILTRTISTEAEARRPEGWLRSYTSAFLFGLMNPLTILLFVAAIPALGASVSPDTLPFLVTGVFLGSASWWLVLSTAVFLVSGRLSAQAIALTNRASGLTLAGLGALMLANACGLHPQ